MNIFLIVVAVVVVVVGILVFTAVSGAKAVMKKSKSAYENGIRKLKSDPLNLALRAEVIAAGRAYMSIMRPTEEFKDKNEALVQKEVNAVSLLKS